MLPFDLRELSAERFSLLCVALLKAEVSPDVRQISLRGSDGGRDAALKGDCATGRYPWSGEWIFQFKRYVTDIAQARRAAVSDLRTELQKTVDRYRDTLDNYIFITSVPYSGNPGTGLHDRVRSFIEGATRKYHLNIDVWDGLEVCNLLLKHSRVRKVFFPNPHLDGVPNLSSFGRAGDIPSSNMLLVPEFHTAIADQSTEVLDFFAESIVPAVDDVLSPSADSILWELLGSGKNHELLRSLDAITAVFDRRRKGGVRVKVDRAYHWLTVSRALVAARLGRAQTAIALSQKTLAASSSGDHELQAWCHNILSISYGKLERRSEYQMATHSALALSSESGNYWLADSIAFRERHKSSWQSAERGVVIDEHELEWFMDERIAMHRRDYRSEVEVEHVRAQRDAYLALQYTWKPNGWDRADRAIESATRAFQALRDGSELTRMISERGRLYLLAYDEPTKALAFLKEALRRRVASGELGRARYDLLWIATAYMKLGFTPYVEVCLALSIAIHDVMYRSRRVDTGLIVAIERTLSEAAGAGKGRMPSGDSDSVLLAVAEEATGLTVAELLVSADYNDLRRVLAEIR